jgi:hypothetical protein
MLRETGSHEIQTALLCDASGLRVTATINGSLANESYNSMEGPETFWDPSIELELTVHPYPPEAGVEVQWIIQEPAHPVILNATIHAADLFPK